MISRDRMASPHTPVPCMSASDYDSMLRLLPQPENSAEPASPPSQRFFLLCSALNFHAHAGLEANNRAFRFHLHLLTGMPACFLSTGLRTFLGIF